MNAKQISEQMNLDFKKGIVDHTLSEEVVSELLEADSGSWKTFKSPEDLFKDLGI